MKKKGRIFKQSSGEKSGVRYERCYHHVSTCRRGGGGRRCIDPIDISPRHNSIEYRMNASSPAGPTSIHFPLSNESRNSVHHDNFSYVKFFSANRPINRQFRVSIKNQDFHFVPSLRVDRCWKRNGGGVIYFYYLIFALLRGG